MVLLEFFLPLEGLHAQEDAAKEEREDEKDHDRAALAQLSSADGHHHGETGEQQDAGVDRAQHCVQAAGCDGEDVRVQAAVNGVHREHPAEEHDFGYQEDPHPQGRGVLLLRGSLELRAVRESFHVSARFASQL